MFAEKYCRLSSLLSLGKITILQTTSKSEYSIHNIRYKMHFSVLRYIIVILCEVSFYVLVYTLGH